MNRTKYSSSVKQTDQKSLYSYNSTEDDSSTYNFEINEGSKFSDHFGLLGKCWKKSFGQIKGDWVFLTLLGVVMAFISLFVEIIIGVCVNSRVYLFYMISDPFLKFWGWLCIPVFLIVFATGLTKLVAPQAAGSGVPELRTAMLGIPMKGSFSFKALCTKIIGLGTTLGTGLPYGKEGPFVHVSSMVAVLLTKLTSNIRGIYADKARNMEMLAAACAVGVTAAFAAPIGGVLFSIEVTAVHFAVRNYWRGFYAAVCGTVMHRFLAVWFNENADFTAVYKTSFYSEEPYALPELLFFALMGAIIGVIGALFVWSNRKCTMFKNNNRIMKTINRNSVFWYPLLVTGIFTTLTFPLGLGYFITSTYTTGGQITEMFVNYSWQKPNPTVEEYKVISHWSSEYTGIWVSLFLYSVVMFMGMVLASTLSVPAGVFTPLFQIGVSFGRLFGEIIYAIFPNGFDETNRASAGIMPGGYAIAGAAALAGAATHTVSSSVIAFELTGQISFAIPVLIATFVANAISQTLQPSIFDSITTMKKLPYLPSILSSSSTAYEIFVEDFMVRELEFIWYGITYNELKNILLNRRKLRVFPVVDSAESMILLGSVHRKELIALLKDNINERKKIPYFNEWKDAAEKELEKDLQLHDDDDTDGSDDLKIEVVNEQETKTETANHVTKPETLSEDIKSSTEKKVAEEPSDENPEATPPTETTSLLKPSSDIQSIDGEPEAVSEYPPGVGLPIEIPNTPDFKLPTQRRRSSRFSVTKVEGPLPASPLIKEKKEKQEPIVEEKEKIEKEEPIIEEKEKEEYSTPNSPNSTVTHGSLPKKSILKKTQSFVFEPNKPGFASKRSYATVHGDISKGVRQSLAVFMRAKSLLRMDSRSSHITFTGVSSAKIPTTRLIKIIKEMESEWENREMEKTVDFTKCQINPAPHQLVERSNLLQVHSIFSLLGLHHSYVTAIGRLIGVVGLKELQQVIVQVNSGDYVKPGVINNKRYSFGFLTLR
ncbi:UNVERIFIED_CONTAM: hypothetical protein RMT77_011914 [Armadillidium vulgare]